MTIDQQPPSYPQPQWASYPPPPPPVTVERPTATAPFVLGVVGSVIGLIPFLGIVAIPLGVIGLVLGVIAWRHRPQRKRLARAATVLSALAIAFGVLGIVIVANAANDLDRSLDCIGNAQTVEEMDAC